MAYSTSTKIIGTDWTLVTNKVAMLQFNDDMYIAITDGTLPSEQVGFYMVTHEKYINSLAGISVYAKSMPNRGTGKESVRVAEDIV